MCFLTSERLQRFDVFRSPRTLQSLLGHQILLVLRDVPYMQGGGEMPTESAHAGYVLSYKNKQKLHLPLAQPNSEESDAPP
jgi:hypothetical protein